MKLRAVITEGWLYWYTAFGAAFLTYISSEEAYKYVSPVWLFWIKSLTGSSIVGFNALKAFRSMTFGRYNNEQSTKNEDKDKNPPPSDG